MAAGRAGAGRARGAPPPPGGGAPGHVMWAFDPDDGAHWIGGMVIDATEQGRGVGRAALRATVALLSRMPGAREIRLSHHPENAAAAALYAAEGFRPTGDHVDGEIVLARALP